MRGGAFFNGRFPASLVTLTFVAGARTDAGVGIGSSRSQLRAAYGSKVRPSKPGQGVYEIVAETRPPRSAIRFYFYRAHAVDRVDFGYAASGPEFDLTAVRC